VLQSWPTAAAAAALTLLKRLALSRGSVRRESIIPATAIDRSAPRLAIAAHQGPLGRVQLRFPGSLAQYTAPMEPERRLDAPTREIDRVALLRIEGRLRAARQPPWLHAEAARRMAERLPLIKLKPSRVADWQAWGSASQVLLKQAYPSARVMAVEDPVMPVGHVSERAPSHAASLAPEPVSSAAGLPWWSPRRWIDTPQAPQRGQDLGAGAVDLVWANMCLHAQPDPVRTFKQWQRVLAVDGFLMFSTLGPGSLQGLAAIYRRLGWPPPFAPFVDMHDMGDMLLEAGLAVPVMDQELLTLSWPSAQALLDELRGLGGNAHPQRHPGLRTPRWAHRLRDALEKLAGPDGRPQLVFELVYGHAFKAAPKAPLAAVTSVPLEDMRRMVRSRGTSP